MMLTLIDIHELCTDKKYSASIGSGSFTVFVAPSTLFCLSCRYKKEFKIDKFL